MRTDGPPQKKIYAYDYRYSSLRTSCQRCRETVELLGESLGVPVEYAVNSGHYGEDARVQDKAAAQLLHYDQIQHVSTIMVAWEHDNIKYLVNYLTGRSINDMPEKIKHWSSTDYRSVVDIRYARGQDGHYHHCDIQVLDQGYDPLPYHGAHSATSCSACHGGSSRRRVGCPKQQ